ncbi:PREDICTED: acid trehalase-like protein 1 [Condylura cristata]|uniref:acid trehalase-like protein 1 n=1 Tax=Condylura cristata TaxID=143302 RepID=UPI000643C552|nr:PREDICTED: acid trehalase-like protein 1 [Condylura cristata]
MEGAGEDPTIFRAHSLPSDPRLLATVTNSYLGTRVYGTALHVSGVYNGAGGDTHRAVLPSPLNMRLEAPIGAGEQLVSTFALDTNSGSFLHTLEGPTFWASHRIYAHRTLPHVLASSVSIARRATGCGAVTVLLRSTFSPESPDLALRLGPCHQGARYLYGHTLTPEQPGGPQQELHMLWTPVPPALTLEDGEQAPLPRVPAGAATCSLHARPSLRFAAALAMDLGRPVPDRWLQVAEGIKVPFDAERGFHPEFDGYELGEEVKQADVVLLGYPVPFPLSPRIRRNNLEVYEAVTSPRGPAMTWSMFAVGWLELRDATRAQALLHRSLANVSEPFKVWTENADGSGAVNFLTGMGGFLQAALFGFTGFRITRAGLTFDPVCPEGVSGVSVWGVSYLGNKLDFSWAEGSVTLEVSAQADPGAPPLEAELWPSRARLPLPPGHRVSFPSSAGRIQRAVA